MWSWKLASATKNIIEVLRKYHHFTKESLTIRIFPLITEISQPNHSVSIAAIFLLFSVRAFLTVKKIDCKNLDFANELFKIRWILDVCLAVASNLMVEQSKKSMKFGYCFEACKLMRAWAYNYLDYVIFTTENGNYEWFASHSSAKDWIY